jgi:hypothetical protein
MKGWAMVWAIWVALLLPMPGMGQDETDWQPLLDRFFEAEVQAAAAAPFADATYMTADERAFLAYANLARCHPREFAAFYEAWLREVEDDEGLAAFEAQDRYYHGLFADLMKQPALPPLAPDKGQWRAARFWARYSGKHGLEGHNRPWYPIKYKAECCAYNPDGSPMTFLLDLLVDEGVRSLGHRRILLGKWTRAGASIQPHKDYGLCLVVDLR